VEDVGVAEEDGEEEAVEEQGTGEVAAEILGAAGAAG
jgi:hypothetical protein